MLDLRVTRPQVLAKISSMVVIIEICSCVTNYQMIKMGN